MEFHLPKGTAWRAALLFVDLAVLSLALWYASFYALGILEERAARSMILIADDHQMLGRFSALMIALITAGHACVSLGAFFLVVAVGPKELPTWKLVTCVLLVFMPFGLQLIYLSSGRPWLKQILRRSFKVRRRLEESRTS